MESSDSHIVPDHSLHSLPEDLCNSWVFHKVYDKWGHDGVWSNHRGGNVNWISSSFRKPPTKSCAIPRWLGRSKCDHQYTRTFSDDDWRAWCCSPQHSLKDHIRGKRSTLESLPFKFSQMTDVWQGNSSFLCRDHPAASSLSLVVCTFFGFSQRKIGRCTYVDRTWELVQKTRLRTKARKEMHRCRSYVGISTFLFCSSTWIVSDMPKSTSPKSRMTKGACTMWHKPTQGRT